MGKQYAPETIQEVGQQLPAGRYLFVIDALDDTDRTSTNKYQIKATLRVLEPEAFAGVPHYHNFVVGTDTDLEADDPETWKKSFAAGLYKQMLTKSGIGMTGDVEDDIAAATGQQVGGTIQQSIQAALNKDGTENKYGGRIQSQVGLWFAPGERETGLEASNGAKDLQGRGPAPAPARASLPAPKAGTLQSPRPSAPAAPAKPAAPAAPRAPARAATIKCTICNNMVDRATFPAHVVECDAARE